MKPIKLLITGCLGRMGQAVIACAERDGEVEPNQRIDIGDSLLAVLSECDTVIDFSYHGFSGELVRGCVELQKPLVTGSTGHSKEEYAFIEESASKLPIVFSPNFSVGVNTLFWLTRKACNILGDGFDIEIVEMHHNNKKDAPSGTARHLAEVACTARQLDYSKDTQHGREGDVGERPKKEIGVHSLRGGDVVGDHTVIFAGSGERVELSHRAASRETFAVGAIRAAKWVQDKPAGLYSMLNVLGLDD